MIVYYFTGREGRNGIHGIFSLSLFLRFDLHVSTVFIAVVVDLTRS